MKNTFAISNITKLTSHGYSVFYSKLFDCYFLLNGPNSFIPNSSENIITVSNARDISTFIENKSSVNDNNFNIDTAINNIERMFPEISFELPFHDFGCVFHQNGAL